MPKVRGKNHHRWNGGQYFDRGRLMLYRPDHPRAQKDRGYVYNSILIVENSIGKHLPKGVVVHHADEDRTNDSSSNLVACESTAYHALLHNRIKAFKATGDPKKRKCRHCKMWDDTTNLSKLKAPNTYHHKKCNAEYESSRLKSIMLGGK